MTISGNFENFQYFNFETNLLETKSFFKKLEYHFLVESTKIENASFPYKTAISDEAYVKTTRMVSGPITKNGVLLVTTLLFLNINYVSV